MSARAGGFLADIGWPAGISATAPLLWEATAGEFQIGSIILPPSSEILTVLFPRRERPLTHLWPSLYATVQGFAPSMIGSVLGAVVVTYSSIIRRDFIRPLSSLVPKSLGPK